MSSRAKGSKELDNLAPTVRRRNAILFKNESAFLHLDPKDRPIAKLHNQQWELYLDTVPIGYLHRTCANVKVNEPLPRQTICYLIKKYVQEHNVSVETLSSSIAAADEDIHKKGLVCRRPEDNKPVFNLQQLSDAGLYRVYTSIPNDHRPAEKTVVVRNRQPNKPPKKRRGRSLFTDKPFGVKKAAPVAQVTQVIPVRQPSFEENFTWVQCDACEKWRRLWGVTEDQLPDQWQCKEHPDEITCADPEDVMDEGEQWDGEIKGTILRINLSGDAPTITVEQPAVDVANMADVASNPSDDSDSDSDDEPSMSQPASEGPFNEGVEASGFTMEGGGEGEGGDDEDLPDGFDLFGDGGEEEEDGL